MMRRNSASPRTSAAIPRKNVAVCALVAMALAACATTPPLREIDASVDRSRIRLAPGQALRVSVEANPATGYRWMVDHAAAGVLQPVGQPLYTPRSTSAPLVGDGGTMTFDFVAVAAGSDTLQLAYRRVAEKNAAVARSLRVEIVVQPTP